MLHSIFDTSWSRARSILLNHLVSPQCFLPCPSSGSRTCRASRKAKRVLFTGLRRRPPLVVLCLLSLLLSCSCVCVFLLCRCAALRAPCARDEWTTSHTIPPSRAASPIRREAEGDAEAVAPLHARRSPRAGCTIARIDGLSPSGDNSHLLERLSNPASPRCIHWIHSRSRLLRCRASG